MYYVFVCSMGSLIFCIFRRFYCYILKDLNKRLWTTIALLYYSGFEFCSSCKNAIQKCLYGDQSFTSIFYPCWWISCIIHKLFVDTPLRETEEQSKSKISLRLSPRQAWCVVGQMNGTLNPNSKSNSLNSLVEQNN